MFGGFFTFIFYEVYLAFLFPEKILPGVPFGLPKRSIAQRKPIVELDLLACIKRRVPGANQ